MSARNLASELAVSKSAVHKLRVASSQPAKKVQTGRPMRITEAQRKAIKAKLDRSGIGTRKLAEWSAERGYAIVCSGTVGAVLKRGMGRLSLKPTKSGRRLSEQNKLLRLKFVKKLLKILRS